MNLELEFTLHEPGFFTVNALVLPGDPVKYELIDHKVGEGPFDATGFKELLDKVRFDRGTKFQFRAIKDGKWGLITIPLPEWPVSSGYMIRVARFGGDLRL